MDKNPFTATRRTRRGVIGIEAAIVLIAFVIVAAALSFVVLNAGFTTTQQAKTTVSQGLQTSSSVLAVSGTVVGHVNGTSSSIDVITLPLRVASGSNNVDLQKSLVAVKYFSKTKSYDNVYAGTLETTKYASVVDALAAATTANLIDKNPLATSSPATPTNSTAIIYWTTNENNNKVLDKSENAILAIVFSSADRPAQLDTVKVEVSPSIGAPLTVERNIPTLTNTYTDLA
jgi:archaeal flagellin FlaB